MIVKIKMAKRDMVLMEINATGYLATALASNIATISTDFTSTNPNC